MIGCMTRQELRGRSPAELIEIILQQQKRIASLEAQVAELEAQIAMLKDRLEGVKKPPKTSRNSSLPPSKSPKASSKGNRGSGKKRGPKPGHPGRSRRRAEPDAIIECRPKQCSRCGADLREIEQYLVGQNQVVELPPIEPVVIEAHQYSADCPVCKNQETAAYLEGMEAERVFGNRVEALASYFHQVQHLSYERLENTFQEVFGLKICQGALVNSIGRTAKCLKPEAEAIRETIRSSAVVGSDETGARVNGRNYWQWVFQNKQASYHVIVPYRSSKAIEEVMGDASPEVWVSDLFSAQLKNPAQTYQICGSHQVRDLQYPIDADRCRFSYQMQQLFLQAERLAKHRDDLSALHFQQQVLQIEKTCDELLSMEVSSKRGRQLQRRYIKHRNHLFVFLYRPDVPFTNNDSERDLRNSVIHRKVSGGFRSDWGADAYATVISVIETAKKRDRPILATLQTHIGPPVPIMLACRSP